MTSTTLPESYVEQETGKHPKGLYVLFATEMWERFSFYSMLALFTLYLRNPDQGFGWTADRATGLYANYLMFVYASPLIGGWLADRKLGYRRAVMLGGLFFMAGHLLLSFPTLLAVYAALACLVIGNGLFKPNVSTMVGNLYPEGSHLKDRAYNIFYMGINIGAFLAPIVMEVVKARWGYHLAFAVAAIGMAFSVGILWWFKQHVEDPNKGGLEALPPRQAANTAAVAADAPPASVSHQDTLNANRQSAMDAVPEWKRIAALIVVFLIVIVFWMVFHQNGSTLTYWADDNTAWNVSGTISNAINPFWIISLTFPLVWFWKWLDGKGKEPATPTKMAIGMLLTALSFYILYMAARTGEAVVPQPAQYATSDFRITDRSLSFLKADGVPDDVIERLKDKEIKDKKFTRVTAESGEVKTGEQGFKEAIGKTIGEDQAAMYGASIFSRAFIFKVSPFWLILAYAVISLGELMLSPMGLSLVSKVAPMRMRGLMMGGWFVATAIGNKLTMIGVFWERWMQSSFFVVLGTMALIMAVVLILLLKPLKKAMPGV
ncbi:MAG TPA: peptide MFS transporter [Blastocatellia bacterium]|jgi:POT family proton-dependent oligopeptide transporter|nr:peptide MFS transporter [Blastocatellia bacterium]